MRACCTHVAARSGAALSPRKSSDPSQTPLLRPLLRPLPCLAARAWPAVGGGDLERAQELLIYGGTAAQHNLEIFWNKCQELEAAGQDPGVRLGAACCCWWWCRCCC